MKKIERIEPTVPQIKRKKKVAAYARVSMETDRLSHSLSAQVSYYSQLIQKNPEWEYAGVYADSFISGTSTKNRTEFQRLIADCEAGKIDVILTNIKTPYLIQCAAKQKTSEVLATKASEAFYCLANIPFCQSGRTGAEPVRIGTGAKGCIRNLLKFGRYAPFCSPAISLCYGNLLGSSFG